MLPGKSPGLEIILLMRPVDKVPHIAMIPDNPPQMTAESAVEQF